jgi:hypothetical protein
MWKLKKKTHLDEKRQALIETLDLLGFYRYASPDYLPGIKQITLKTGNLFPDFPAMSYSQVITQKKPLYRIVDPEPDGTKRAYFVDAENLYEQGTKVFIEEMSPILRVFGVHINALGEDVSDEKGLSVTINGITFQIESKRERDAGVNLWMLTTTRIFAALNVFLAESGSDERLYYRVNAGNDAQAIFLTDLIYRAIESSDVIPKRDIPVPA